MASEVWGAHVAESGDDGAVRIKFDGAPWRVQIHPAERDETAYLGWGVDHEEDLDTVAAALSGMDVTASFGDRTLAEARAVDRLLVFEDPWGFRHEVVWGHQYHHRSFVPGRPMSGFVTGEQGLGHVLLHLPDIEEGHRFFRAIGFRLSDKIVVPNGLNARFYHCNARHHTLALAECEPGRAGLGHLMIQVQSIDDMGTGYDLVQERDIPVTLTLGRHTNDLQLSFYHATPSSMHVEYGYGGVELDDESWVPKVYEKTAIWGHHRAPELRDLPSAIWHAVPDRSDSRVPTAS